MKEVHSKERPFLGHSKLSMFLSNHSFIHSKMFMKCVKEAILLQVWDTEITCKVFHDVVPPPSTALEHAPSWRFWTFSCFCPEGSSLRYLFVQLFPLRTRLHVTSLEMLSSHSLYPHPALFSFTALITTCHLQVVFICYMFVLPSLECNVHESRVFALLTAGTLCLQQCPTQRRHFILIEWMNTGLVPKMPPV